MSTVLSHRSAAGFVVVAALIAASGACSSDSQTPAGETGGSINGTTGGSGGMANAGAAGTAPATDPVGGAAGADPIDNEPGGAPPPMRSTTCTLASDFDCVCGGEGDPDPRCGLGNRVGQGPNTDMNCTTTFSSSSANPPATCTMDCVDPCGFDQLGIELCTCENGFYSNCNCSEPADFVANVENAVPSCSTIPLPPGAVLGDMNPLCAPLPETQLAECIEILEPSDGEPFPCETAWQACAGADPEAVGNANRGCVCLPQIDIVTLEFVDPPVMLWECGSTNSWFARDFAAP